MSRIYTALKGANVVTSNTWLKPKDSQPVCRQEVSAEGAMALARCARNREQKKRLALLERQEPKPIDAAVSEIVAMVRSGRMNIDDLVATQRAEQDRLQALRVMHGRNEESVRLAASTEVRRQAIERVKRDPYLSVVAPSAAKVAEANDCHNPPGVRKAIRDREEFRKNPSKSKWRP